VTFTVSVHGELRSSGLSGHGSLQNEAPSVLSLSLFIFPQTSVSFISLFDEEPAKDTLRAMTIYAARMLGVDTERGTIRPGLASDSFVTSENPLDNIQAVRKVSFVMKDGRDFKNE
jgi:hypothetical protein